jgi:hypothetical protein
MKFVLRGFRQVTGARVFTFESMADRPHSLFTVHADLGLAQRYRIPLQELPLLCRAVLERYEGGEERAFSFTEQDMCVFADGVAARAEAAKQRKAPRRPAAATNNVGAAWRGPQR